MNKKIKRLEDLIELYKSNTITKAEYEDLKKELFIDTNEKLNNDFIKPKTENKEIDKNQNNYQKEIIYLIVMIACVSMFFLLLHNYENKKNEEFNTSFVDSESSSIESISNICSICGNEFHNRGYKEVSDRVWQELEEGNQGQICSPACGRKHNQQFNDVAKKYGIDLEDSETNSSSEGGYKMGNDGRVYEQNKCSLCKGTGIETGRNIATGQTEGRICPMCDGRGVRSY